MDTQYTWGRTFTSVSLTSKEPQISKICTCQMPSSTEHSQRSASTDGAGSILHGTERRHYGMTMCSQIKRVGWVMGVWHLVWDYEWSAQDIHPKLVSSVTQNKRTSTVLYIGDWSFSLNTRLIPYIPLIPNTLRVDLLQRTCAKIHIYVHKEYVSAMFLPHV